LSTEWKLTDGGRIWFAMINGNEYEVYETEPGMQRVRRDGQLIAETFTTEEGKRWAESYDKWLTQVAPSLPRRPEEFGEPELIGDILRRMDFTEQRFPRYPEEFV